jgi:glycerol 2-dehydrogenase (NADP+)
MGGGAEYAQTAKEILSHPLFTDIAAAHGIPAGVVSLSWAFQRGIIVIPKSSSTARIDSNIRLVRLTDTEMEAINNAENTIGRIRLADNIPAMQKEFRGRKTVMGWTAEDYGWEDSEGNWLT